MSAAVVESSVLVWRSIFPAERPQEQPDGQNEPKYKTILFGGINCACRQKYRQTD